MTMLSRLSSICVSLLTSEARGLALAVCRQRGKRDDGIVSAPSKTVPKKASILIGRKRNRLEKEKNGKQPL
jgi:hypothetical protein